MLDMMVEELATAFLIILFIGLVYWAMEG